MKIRNNFEDRQTPIPKGTRFPDVRERLIGTALRIIADEGSSGFSLNEVLRRSKVSKGSFFHHFKNLDDLCQACFEKCKELLVPHTDPKDYKSVRELLLAFGEETLQRTVSNQFVRLTMFFGDRAMSDPRYLEIQKSLTEIYQGEVARLILAISPELKLPKVLDAVGFLLVVSQGVATHRVIFRDRTRMERVWPYSVDAALELMGLNQNQERSSS